MQLHPLERPSLAPYGFVFPSYQRRLEFTVDPKTGPFVNTEQIIGKAWEEANLVRHTLPPVKAIIHQMLPSLDSRYMCVDPARGDFEQNGLPYMRRDILVLSSGVQWLATNVGNAFLETPLFYDVPKAKPDREFEIKWQDALKRNDMPMFIAHECTSSCGHVGYTGVAAVFGGLQCHYDPKQVSHRHRTVLKALMKWLDSPPGREFIKHYAEMRQVAQLAAREEHKKAQAA